MGQAKHRTLRISSVLIVLLLLFLSGFPIQSVRAQSPSFTSGMKAALVLGQPNFNSLANATTSSGLYGPTSLRFDSSGDLWVIDQLNNRILEFKPPFSNGMSASVVLGQTGFTAGGKSTTQTGLFNPGGLAFDSSGDLWVGDSGNNRILEFKPPFSNGMDATLVIGQTNFTTSISLPGCLTNIGETTCAGSLADPMGLAFDSRGDLWVADSSDARVLEYTPPFASTMNASLEVGEPSLIGVTGGPGQNLLLGPTYIAFDSSGNLWVSDDNRVLQFKVPFSDGMNASLVLGQPDYMSSLSNCNTCFTLSSALFITYGIAFDPGGNLWVTDSNGGRVLQFRAPFSTFMNATLAIGKLNVTSIETSCPLTQFTCQSSLSGPMDVTFDSSGNLWVSDTPDNRILEFGPLASSGTGSTTAQSTAASSTATSSHTLASTTTSVSASTLTSSPSATSSTSSGKIPEFPLQAMAMTLFTVTVLGAYLFARRRLSPRG